MPTKTQEVPVVPPAPEIPHGADAWRQAKALRLRERREVMVTQAHTLIDGDNMGGATNLICQIMEVDGEIAGLEARS